MLVRLRRLRQLTSICIALAALVVMPSFGQFLPRPPRDPRPERAKIAFEAGRYEESARILDEYLEDDPQNAEAWLFLAWSRYRLGEFETAARHFERSIRAEPASIDAIVGLGYAKLQTEGPESATKLFLRALERDPSRGDALRGLVLAGRRKDAPPWVVEQGVSATRKLEQIEGRDVETLISAETLKAGVERRPRRPRDAEIPLDAPWRAGVDYLESRQADGSWQPLFVKGVDLVVGLPGRLRSDTPNDRELYGDWLRKIADLGANTVRVYDLLPPAFYEALASHNEASGNRKLWLVQGIWMELPPEFDFEDSEYERSLEEEIARIVDAVHGNLAIGPRPARPWGSYDRDVSEWLIAYVVGRNWEPFAVHAFNQKKRHLISWSGDWLAVRGARPMEAWLARICDQTIAHEVVWYREIHPISFINAPSLDPLHHPTEATRAEENVIRAELGLPPLPEIDEAWNDDEVSLDATLIEASSSNPAGAFASYQIYPYYPDFMSHEYPPTEGRSSYEQYLAALKQHHGNQPVLVVEFGISTSRGIAHQHSGGRHHGGHDELSQGALIATMLHEINRQRLAGGVVFSFMDEWSRSTWNTSLFELPEERDMLWFNVQSPDQAYGLFRAAPTSAPITIDGSALDWQGIPIHSSD